MCKFQIIPSRTLYPFEQPRPYPTLLYTFACMKKRLKKVGFEYNNFPGQIIDKKFGMGLIIRR